MRLESLDSASVEAPALGPPAGSSPGEPVVVVVVEVLVEVVVEDVVLLASVTKSWQEIRQDLKNGTCFY